MSSAESTVKFKIRILLGGGTNETHKLQDAVTNAEEPLVQQDPANREVEKFYVEVESYLMDSFIVEEDEIPGIKILLPPVTEEDAEPVKLESTESCQKTYMNKNIIVTKTTTQKLSSLLLNFIGGQPILRVNIPHDINMSVTPAKSNVHSKPAENAQYIQRNERIDIFLPFIDKWKMTTTKKDGRLFVRIDEEDEPEELDEVTVIYEKRANRPQLKRKIEVITID